MNAVRNSGNPLLYSVVALLLAVIGSGAAWYVYSRGYTLYYGDAEAHLNIARRWIDSRTPGPEQLGTAWLPLPHLLMTPFVANDTLWHNGLAGVFPSIACFVIAGTFLFASARRLFDSNLAAFCALAVFGLNPNMLYLQSIPMTESIMAAALAVLLWATLRYRESPSTSWVFLAAIASNAASLTRYEGWFLIPFVTIFFGLGGRNFRHAITFGALASLGPLAWLAHNYYYLGDALAFYRGPYSAMAIYKAELAQGGDPYPGDHNWLKAVQYYLAAVRSVVGWPLAIVAILGLIAAIRRPNLRWPMLLLSLSPVFYVLSMHSSGTPIFVPDLWPFSWYNTRYGLAALILTAFAVGSLANLLPLIWQRVALGLIAVIALTPTAICWKESQVNSVSRREWTQKSAEFLSSHYYPHQGILFFFGDLAGIFRYAGIPLREGLHQDNGLIWDASLVRPDLFAANDWALAIEGDPISAALRKTPRYRLVKRVIVKGAPPVEIYRRQAAETFGKPLK